MTTEPTFQELKAKLDHLKRAHHAGRDVYPEMQQVAQQAAEAFNAESTRIAKARGIKRPKLITATGLLR